MVAPGELVMAERGGGPGRPLQPAGRLGSHSPWTGFQSQSEGAATMSQGASMYSGYGGAKAPYIGAGRHAYAPMPVPQPVALQNPSPRMGFTPEQLAQLRDQILLFRRLKHGETILRDEVLQFLGIGEYGASTLVAPRSAPGGLQPPNVPSTAGPAGPALAPQGPAMAVHASQPVMMAPAKLSGAQADGRELTKEERRKLRRKLRDRERAAEKRAAAAAMAMQQHPHPHPLPPHPQHRNFEPNHPHFTSSSAADRMGSAASLKAPAAPGPPPREQAMQPWQSVAHAPPDPVEAPDENSLSALLPGRASAAPPLVGLSSWVERMRSGAPPAGTPSLGLNLSGLCGAMVEETGRLVGERVRRRLEGLTPLMASGNPGLPAPVWQRLRILQRSCRLMPVQAQLRAALEGEQQEIAGMGDRSYRKFQRWCQRQHADVERQAAASAAAAQQRRLKSLLGVRRKLLEAQWSLRESRSARNKGVLRFHERSARERNKRADEERVRRMEALKNNDMDGYREMLEQQRTAGTLPEDAGERFEVLSSFLAQTEDYLTGLSSKISAVKLQQEREEALCAAAAAARLQGLSEEEVEERVADAAAEWVGTEGEEGGEAANRRYYNLAHSVRESIGEQPRGLAAGKLRDYQMVGLQWLVSLYNNRLNGILADEMGLGKTVQVMALLAHLMEEKNNYGPHLIIVPNAVIVNWKSELMRWLPSASCLFYVGNKDVRARMFAQEVLALRFNVLVTTFEFVMRDRARLFRVEWKYLIIDEAQRMKDRESRLARDLQRMRCQRRLLLTGTPLQNDLRELWSLLNLLLPEVFDNHRAFHDWFAAPFQRGGAGQAPSDDVEADEWLAMEKKVIVIHRLHQILEPFMLRRRVEDVEGQLPPKVSIVLKCRMSGLQAAVYDWVKATGTLRSDPQVEARKVGPNRAAREFAPLQNKCMELRKVCNHPFLCYTPAQLGLVSAEACVRTCGKLHLLDRILVKLHRSGHRVLLFSTMTRLLDILEEYLVWRGLAFRRIDGSTSLEAREAAIVDFNREGSDCFLFLLSIRAAGRGLNLQSADTVIIYDPDPNPQNEEQAVARAHRIGQKREVRVLYLESVVDRVPAFVQEDEAAAAGASSRPPPPRSGAPARATTAPSRPLCARPSSSTRSTWRTR